MLEINTVTENRKLVIMQICMQSDFNDRAAQQRLCKASSRKGSNSNYSTYEHFASS
jgi:hypothetical protein